MLTLETIVRVTAGAASPDLDLSREASGVSTDTRALRPGEVFFALRGPRFDGHDFIPAAQVAGAAAAVVRTGYCGSRTIAVPDVLWALGELARFWRHQFALPVVAVTGSNGKTTTKNLIAAVLGQNLSVHKTAGNLNNLVGLPLTVLGLEKSHQAAVFELGTSARGEIARLAQIAQPSVGVITNVGPAHLAGLTTVEEVRGAKLELLAALKPEHHAVVNLDSLDPGLVRAATSARVVTFAIQNPADFRAKNVTINHDQTRFIVGRTKYTLLLFGEHNVYNALAAVAVGHLLGIEEAACAAGLFKVRPEPGRTQLIRRHGLVIIDDTYNSNPVSVRAALATLARVRARRRVAVLGDMLELGKDSPLFHAEIGQAARKTADLVVLVGPQMAAARNGSLNLLHFPNKEQALDFLRTELARGDAVLVKGSRAMAMEEIVAALKRG